MPENSVRIKVKLLERGETVASVARELGVKREELSMTIHNARHYPEIRKALAEFLGLPSNSRLLAFTPKRRQERQAV